jgi:hypothetical protein
VLSRKPNPVRLRLAPSAPSFGVTIIPLAPPLLAGSSGLPGDFGRAVLQRLPIWPCSVRGFACHRCCHRRGALLPHLFTLTLLRSPVPCGSGELRRTSSHEPAPTKREARSRAVYFLCHFPSGYPDRALPGALPCGVRTFLPPMSPLRASSNDDRLQQPRIYLPLNRFIYLTIVPGSSVRRRSPG